MLIAVCQPTSPISEERKIQHMNIYQHTCIDRTPYTYLIGWSAMNKWYYGVRFGKNCHPEDLWKTYFTSSKHVKEFRIINGEPDVIEIRKIFYDINSCQKWEQKVLRRLETHKNTIFLNKSVGHKKFYASEKTDLHKKNISEALKGKSRSKEHCINISIALKGKDSNNWRGENNPSLIHKGKETHHAKNNKYMKDKKHSAESRKKMSDNNILKKDPYAHARVRWTDENRKQHSKEMIENNYNAKIWKIISKETGEIFIVDKLKCWCIERNIKYTSITWTKKSQKFHKGFMVIDTL